jgi:hypothetical protein
MGIMLALVQRLNQPYGWLIQNRVRPAQAIE